MAYVVARWHDVAVPHQRKPAALSALGSPAIGGAVVAGEHTNMKRRSRGVFLPDAGGQKLTGATGGEGEAEARIGRRRRRAPLILGLSGWAPRVRGGVAKPEVRTKWAEGPRWRRNRRWTELRPAVMKFKIRALEERR